jgi:hypothetical protein
VPVLRDSVRKDFSRFENAMFPGGYKKIKALSYKGIIVQEEKKIHTHYYHEKDKRFWIKTDFGGRVVYPVVYTPRKKIKWKNGAYEPMKKEEIVWADLMLGSEWSYLPFYLVNEVEGLKMEKIPGITQIDGRNVKGYSIIYKNNRFNFYFDTKHHFLIRTEKFKNDGNLDFEIDFMDFRPVSGNNLAHYWIIKTGKSPEPIKIIWNKIKMNYIETLKM